MHRFYVFHSLAAFHRNAIAAAALFLAAKVEEQPRKLEHVIKVAHICLHRENPNLDTKSEAYLEQAQDLVFNENVLLQTLGFDVAIDHPHTHVVRCCHLVRASKDLAQTSYFMASNSLHLTTMCLQYKPTVVACFCIHLACKWSNWEIPRSNEGKDWFWYVDKTVTLELLEQLTGEFLAIFDKCPTKLKRKMMSMNQNNSSGFPQPSIPHDSLQFVSNFEEPRKLSGTDANKPPEGLFPVQKQLPSDKPSTSASSSSSSNPQSHPHHQKIDYREYREKKERERLEREKQQQQQQQHHHHQQQRDSHGSVSTNSHHHAKGGPMSTKGPPTAQSRSSSSSSSHKAYQQQPHIQQSAHFQNAKDNSDSSSAQNFSKDSNYLKQHPPHMDRDSSKDSNYHGQYSQSSNAQHQNYSHKLDYSHRDGSRTNHSNQGGSNLSQSHHSQSHSSSNQRDFSQREGIAGKDGSEAQSQPPKKDMSSSIRDIIGQTLPQTDSHSMTNERKDARDKSRGNHMYGNMTLPNSRPEVLKNGREQSKLFHDAAEKKADDFRKERSFKKEEEEPAMDNKSLEPITMMKSEKFDETDSMENFTAAGSNSWNYDFGFKSEKKEAPASTKVDPGLAKAEAEKGEAAKSDAFSGVADITTNKAVHSMRGIYDSKYKSHHYPSGNKNSDVSQFKNDKQSAQCSSDITKKFSDRLHDKHRKGESDRISHLPEAGPAGDISKHKLKEMQEKHKVLMPGQQHIDQKLKERSSPSKYTKMKVASRPSNLDFLKSDSGHFSLDATVNSVESDKTASAVKAPASEDSSKISNINSFHKQGRTHDFGGLSSSIPDSMKTSKTCSIFSPDSKIPPQNILSSLEKESKKGVSIPHRTHSSSVSSPTSTPVNVKTNVSTPATAPTGNSVSTGSLFSPPLPKPSQPVAPRHRTSSSGSEPELIPLLTKIEETPGYENVIREKKIAIPASEKPSDREKSADASLFDFDLKSAAAKPADVKLPSQFATAKQVPTAKLPGEIRSDLGAVIYPNNPKSASVSKPSQSFSLTEPKLSLSNSISTVNLSGIEKMVDTSISPAKQTGQYGSGASIKSTMPMNINLHVSSGSSNAFPAAPAQPAEIAPDQKTNPTMANQEIIDVEDISHSDGKKKSEKKKKKEKHKHKDKDKDRSERKKEKKKHKEKDKEKVKEKEKHKEKDRSREKEKHREKEIDVVNSEAVNSEAPIKITIPKDKISGGLKIKIPKDYLKKEGEVDSPKFGTSGELKIKISKDKFSNVGTYKEESKSSKKRERSPKPANEMPYPKIMKTEKKVSSSSRSNGTDGSSRNSSSHRHSTHSQ
ncbi:UNVERIFIED_CONTAM: hypothetical protein PYX00_010086 [Menopon gallinae]